MKRDDHMLKGRRVLVTGASGGLGSQVVSDCAQNEAELIIITGRNEEKLHRIEEELKGKCDIIRLCHAHTSSMPSKITD